MTINVNRNSFVVRISIEEYNRTKHLQALILRNRYWHDTDGQPRRNPTMRPLIHNGKAHDETLPHEPTARHR